MICTLVSGKLVAMLGDVFIQVMLQLSPAAQKLAPVLMDISVYQKCCCCLLPRQQQRSTQSWSTVCLFISPPTSPLPPPNQAAAEQCCFLAVTGRQARPVGCSICYQSVENWVKSAACARDFLRFPLPQFFLLCPHSQNSHLWTLACWLYDSFSFYGSWWKMLQVGPFHADQCLPWHLWQASLWKERRCWILLKCNHSPFCRIVLLSTIHYMRRKNEA